MHNEAESVADVKHHAAINGDNCHERNMQYMWHVEN
jgi:hypothetical protein